MGGACGAALALPLPPCPGLPIHTLHLGLLKLPLSTTTPFSFQGPLLLLTVPSERSLAPSRGLLARTHPSWGLRPSGVLPAAPSPCLLLVLVSVGPSQTEETFGGRDQLIAKTAPTSHASKRSYFCILNVSWM